jgi:glycogen debranching enzyme
MRLKNHGLTPLETFLYLYFRADYADIFEVRGIQRAARGSALKPEVWEDRVILGYEGLDGVVRRTVLRFSPRPSKLTASSARLILVLQPQEEARFDLAIACEISVPASVVPKEALGTSAAASLVPKLCLGTTDDAPVLTFEAARSHAEADRSSAKAWACHLQTSNGQINTWINRAVADLYMMMTDLDAGPYPYAGVPWYNTPFGRDGIITALECLWLRPNLARGVLAYLAATQATALDPAKDAEPGKILHETRKGEMAALKEIPFGLYYGSVDATPLFVVLAGAYYDRSGDRAFIESLWPNIEAALEWIDRFGDRDGDGFIEYERQSEVGLVHQGWKDSDDAVFHADGSLARGPIALCEVQAYVYAARMAAASLAHKLGQMDQAAKLHQQAETLRRRFEEVFWCEELSTYALALDGEKKPCRVRTSNAGHCLFTGIVAADRARRLAETFLARESYSGWGIRTVAATEPRYNPMSYHNGSIWPHDNALIALGLARHGMGQEALQIWTGMYEAGCYLELHRMPELFCGFTRDAGEAPILYPVACAPQAWAAASVFLLFQACLGLTINGPAAQVFFHRPRLPAALNELRIHNLEVAGATVDLLLVRHEHDVGVDVLRRDGNVQVLVMK